MTQKSTFLGKALVSTICLLFIISIGLNIYQYNTINSERNDNTNKARNFISDQAATFANVFSAAGSTNILEYIKKPDHLSQMIESIQIADSYYLAASKLVSDQLSGKGIIESRNLISNGYLSELRAYRTFLESNSNGAYENIDQIAIAINDLQTISNWLIEKNKNNDSDVYTDNDFYKEVYVNLKSDIKNHYFTGFSS
ncbi:hypothetical protein KCTCHS21_33910 [Cohnella abietis]|uniref:Chemotaxis methyl-accepting receptor HlyB-like 4HB MCP domain-containing protein n=2 Tax=Cohnella abietis TaxID=2507935 RepID=A0A3T1D7D3_9BACL|nr:hypothetical protein KCTCHS21_33910 [Cohnella abietis]